jgi:hypothetical protein
VTHAVNGGPFEDATHAAAGLEVFVHEAYKDGRAVARLRCVRKGDGYTVEADAWPVSASPDEPPLRRSFAFVDRQEAERFAADATRALAYLGCRVT